MDDPSASGLREGLATPHRKTPAFYVMLHRISEMKPVSIKCGGFCDYLSEGLYCMKLVDINRRFSSPKTNTSHWTPVQRLCPAALHVLLVH
jgi:hypothetical protein